MDKPVDFKYPTFPIVESVCQSPPIDPNALYDDSWVKGRCILITGGARGFGAGFTRRWAANGAVVIFCDTNIAGSERLVQDVRKETGNTNVHFIYCDVTDWQSQVELFKKAAWLSPHGGIDAVVANAGVAGVDHFERPVNLDADGPTKPNLKAIEVNLVGVLYTTHLALFWLPRNPGSGPSGKNTDPASTVRDRHMLLVGSMASLSPIPGQTLYGSSKHGVLGLFRNLRAISFIHGIRVNLLCPYFVDTPIFTAKARALLAGGGMGTASDVVEAANRFTCDCRIVGRSLCVGPKMEVIQGPGGDFQPAVKGSGRPQAVWEAYAHDFEDSEIFSRNVIRLLNALTSMRGCRGWLRDLVRAFIYGILERFTGRARK